ncbi:hypothetical protein B0H14DRAFT_2573882 [Mycena olivaceomarginata]|nr:hypothetical protein B0H14DRAFT_2573882 [Mycena olivaceomarginata]
MFLPSHVSSSPPSVHTSPPCSPPSWLKAGVWVEREMGVWVESESERDGCRVYLATRWRWGCPLATLSLPPVPLSRIVGAHHPWRMWPGGAVASPALLSAAKSGGRPFPERRRQQLCSLQGAYLATYCFPTKTVRNGCTPPHPSPCSWLKVGLWVERESGRDGCRVYLATCAHHPWRMWPGGAVASPALLSAAKSGGRPFPERRRQQLCSLQGVYLATYQFIERTEGPEPLYTFLPGADNQPPFTLEEKPKCSWHQAQSPGEKTSATVD